jgi:hypothetical protein
LNNPDNTIPVTPLRTPKTPAIIKNGKKRSQVNFAVAAGMTKKALTNNGAFA